MQLRTVRQERSVVSNEIGSMSAPCIFVIAGPNGAGKSTSAATLLRDKFKIKTYLNADTIAAGLSAFNPEAAAFQAGRVMLQRMLQLRKQKETFAFETTLASKSYVPWLRQAQDSGYKVGLLFLSLSSPEAALERVAHRVLVGGHDIPEDVVRRRFDRGLRNFFQLYQPLVDQWVFTDNGGRRTILLAHGGSQRTTVEKSPIYSRLKEQYGPG